MKPNRAAQPAASTQFSNGEVDVQTLLASSIRKGAAWRAGLRGERRRLPLLVLVVGAAFFALAAAASAETVTSEEPVVLDNGETVLDVSELTAEAATTVAGTTIKCKKVHGWRGLKHPLFGYFYWKYILIIRWCWEAGGSLIVKTYNPWSPTYWREVECCLQYSAWDFKGHQSLDVDGGPNRSQYRVRAQGKFQQCLQYCFNTKTPWVRLTGYPGGAWGFAHGN